MPKVSVIMPAYNAEKYIAEAIDSILAQTYTDYEFIILNDCSTDRTEEIILSFKDSRIVYLKNEENMGVAKTLNRGLSVARGEYIARMDADDISLPERFEKQVAWLDAHPQIGVLGCNVESFDENGAIATGWSSTDPEQMKIDLFFSCGLAHPSVMMRREAVQRGYAPEYNGLEDYELWCRASEAYGVTTLPEVLFRYRIHSSQVTKNPSAEYLQRVRSLKRRQLERLGVNPDSREAEAYYSFCQGIRPETAEQVKALSGLFEQVIEANNKSGYYHRKLLTRTLRSVLIQAVVKLPAKQRKAVAAVSQLFCYRDVWHLLAKQNIKKLLGRK